ncbi:hypothetical protein ANN_23468 [Periplaneta americana]|uniref:Uncharacterized protein n=1 Tax=Periplaneta americana TaxID=6978 RepID=A0ABQ8SMH3_PERAM|nr:hypothetical protein ANN_23468 [Periplaneta americana]
MSPGTSIESYPAFYRIGLREKPGKNLNQVTCPDRDSNPGHLVSRPDVLTGTPQVKNTIRAALRYATFSDLRRGIEGQQEDKENKGKQGGQGATERKGQEKENTRNRRTIRGIQEEHEEYKDNTKNTRITRITRGIRIPHGECKEDRVNARRTG